METEIEKKLTLTVITNTRFDFCDLPKILYKVMNRRVYPIKNAYTIDYNVYKLLIE